MLHGSERVARITLGLLLVYSAIVAVSVPAPIDKEVFPFFRWELFARTPERHRSDYGVRFTEVDGRQLERPVYFEEASGFIPTSRSPDAQAAIKDLGEATEHHDSEHATRNRDLLESRHLQALTSATYEVVRRTYDVLERVDCISCYDDDRVVATYELGAG